MKIVGLVTEYNPFHNGHKYHIEKAKEITGADYCIAVMSGDFVQRGAPAFLPKHLRTEMALSCGADLVLELPVCYASGSAEFFARGAVSLLNSLGCIDYICFGSESGDYQSLETIANVLYNEPLEYQQILQNFLKNGDSFPVARTKALKEYFHDISFDHLLDHPNNILGIEYIKALKQLDSKIKGCTITRLVSAYHDTELSETYSSASAIRNCFSGKDNADQPDFTILESQMPSCCISIMKEYFNKRFPVSVDDLSLLLKYQLLKETKESLTKYQDVTKELANRIINRRNEFKSFSQFCDLLKTKELTYSRISRCLTHILLQIKTDTVDTFRQNGNCFYARVLGFCKDSSPLLRYIKESSSIPLITKINQSEVLCDKGKEMLHQDLFASDFYESIVSDKFNIAFINEFQKQLVIK